MKTQTRFAGIAAAIFGATAVIVVPVEAHHSFAMYDMGKTMVVTGVVDGIDPAPNHLSINFAIMNDERNNVIRGEDGKPVFWSVEMAGSAAMARQGVTVSAWPRGTVFSVALHPLRNGEPGGTRDGTMFRCPTGADGQAVRPEPGKHCDSVEGSVAIGDGPLPAPSE